MKADPAVDKLHAVCDVQTARLLKQAGKDGNPCVCSAGCSACCYEPVYVDVAEVQHALGRLTPQQRKVVKKRTQEWLDKVVPSGLLGDQLPNVFKWRVLRAPCPFLEQDERMTIHGLPVGRCMIYQDRPVACRLHIAIGPRENCYSEEKRKGQIFAYAPEVIERCEAFLLSTTKKLDQDNLGVILGDILLHKRVPSASRLLVSREIVTMMRTGKITASARAEAARCGLI